MIEPQYDQQNVDEVLRYEADKLERLCPDSSDGNNHHSAPIGRMMGHAAGCSVWGTVPDERICDCGADDSL